MMGDKVGPERDPVVLEEGAVGPGLALVEVTWEPLGVGVDAEEVRVLGVADLLGVDALELGLVGSLALNCPPGLEVREEGPKGEAALLESF